MLKRFIRALWPLGRTGASSDRLRAARVLLLNEAKKFCCCTFNSSILCDILRVASSFDSKSSVAFAFDLWRDLIKEPALGKDAASWLDVVECWTLDLADCWIFDVADCWIFDVADCWIFDVAGCWILFVTEWGMAGWDCKLKLKIFNGALCVCCGGKSWIAFEYYVYILNKRVRNFYATMQWILLVNLF